MQINDVIPGYAAIGDIRNPVGHALSPPFDSGEGGTR